MSIKKNILVTGSAGFIGYHLVNKLCLNGHKVFGVDNLNSYYDVQLKRNRLKELKLHINSKSFTFCKLDIANLSELENCFKKNKFDIIINLAAQAGVRYSLENPHEYIRTNINGFMNILECCRKYKVDNLIYASSSSVYGSNTKLPFSEKDRVDTPLSIYATTKKTNELMAHTYSHLYGLNTIGLRFFTVYGPWGRPDMALHIFTDNIINNKPLKIFNNGKHSRSFTYIDDIIDSIYKLIFKSDLLLEKYLIFNIGGDKPINLMDYVALIEETLSIKGSYEFLPLQKGDVKKTESDTDYLYQAINFKPQTNLDIGIKKFINWYIKYYKI